MEIFEQYGLFILAAAALVLLVLCVINFVKIHRLKKRYERFMGTKSKNHNIEIMLSDYMQKAQNIGAQHEQLLADIRRLDEQIAFCVQKVAMVRYNPFDDMGGKLSFVLALLDQNNTGVVINGIHSREHCYVYSKAVVGGKSDYELSEEEIAAIEEAIKKTP